MHKDVSSVLITEEELTARIKEMAEQINKDYEGKSILVVCVLKGAVMFMAELTKYIKVPVFFDFISVSSYGNATRSTGVVRFIKDLDQSIEGKNVLIVEDIVDTGLTLKYLLENMWTRKPASLKLCTLLSKPERRKVEIDVDYVGFTIADEFVIGYGLDYAEKYRNLPAICILSKSAYE